MSIKHITKDITTVKLGIIGHQVNCQGAMGSGVAKALYYKWPKVKQRFLQHPIGQAQLGKIDVFNVEENIMVANLYGQLGYGHDGGKYTELDSLHQALLRLLECAKLYNLPIFLPQIGSGLGGADWETEVYPIIEDVFQNENIPVTICYV